MFFSSGTAMEFHEELYSHTHDGFCKFCSRTVIKPALGTLMEQIKDLSNSCSVNLKTVLRLKMGKNV